MTDFAADNYYSRHDGTEDYAAQEGDDLTPMSAAVEVVRDGWPGHHFTRDGALFEAPPVRDDGATARLIEYAVETAAPVIEAAVRAQVAAEILRGENWTPRGPLSCYGCPVCADVWESEATCTHWPAIQWAARTAGVTP